MVHAASGRRGLVSSLVAAGVVFVAALSPGCRDRPAAPDPRRAQLTIGYGDSRPRASIDRGIRTIATTLTSERLLVMGRSGRPEPALVERWTAADDGLAWRLTLRRGLTLHDGTPLTARLVTDWLTRTLQAIPPADRFPGLRSVASVETAGDLDFIVHLSRPDDLLLEGLNYFPPQGGRGGDQTAGPFTELSNGPEGVAFTAFKSYYKGAPQLERIRIREFPSARNAWGAMMRGEIDFLYDVPPEAFDFVDRSSTAVVTSFLRPYVTALVFNQTHPVLRQRDVRLALNHAINRGEIIRTVLRDRGLAAQDHVWPRHWAYDTTLPGFTYDAARAAALLDARELRPNRGHDRARPFRFSFTCLVLADEPRFEQLALLVQRELVEIGVDMRLEAVTLPVMAQRLRTGKYEAFIFEMLSGHGFSWPDWFWRSSAAPAYIRTGYTAADTAFDRLRDARSDADRRAAVTLLQRTMREDPPAVFLYWNEQTRAVTRRFAIPPIGDKDILSTLAQWRLASPGAE
jgi:peptide/nickel transport system substrate-binding protein